jgi:hypothetical protein
MTPVVMLALMWNCADPGDNCCQGSVGYLYDPSYVCDYELRGDARPYCPKPGDVFLATDSRAFWYYGYKLVGSGQPHHSGTIFRRSNGQLAVLEAGPHDTRWIRTTDIQEHLVGYQNQPGGRVWIRQKKEPLTACQCAKLTEYAEMEDGKHFAGPRMFWQLTHIRTKNPVLLNFLGKPHGPDKIRYYCCELGLEGLVYSGIIDAETTRPLATWPKELFDDASKNRYLNEHPPLKCGWEPPARWVECPGVAPSGPERKKDYKQQLPGTRTVITPNPAQP